MSRSTPPAAHLLASPEDVEAQFYEALREADLDRLMALWSDDDEVVCILPGGPRLVGPQAIRAAFERLLAGGRVPALPERVHRLQTLQTAVHGVIERVQLPGPGEPRGAWVLATNVYFKTAQGWRLVAHHASPGRPSEAPEADEVPAVLH